MKCFAGGLQILVLCITVMSLCEGSKKGLTCEIRTNVHSHSTGVLFILFKYKSIYTLTLFNIEHDLFN